MKRILFAACAALFINQASAHAEGLVDSELLESTQIGTGVGSLDMNLNDAGLIFYVTAQKELDIILGDFDSYGVVRLGRSTAAKTGSVESKLDYILSGLFKANFPIESNMNIYGLAGFSASQVTETVAAADDSYGDLSFTYGFGWSMEIIDQLSLGAEYTEYSTRATAFSINASYIF